MFITAAPPALTSRGLSTLAFTVARDPSLWEPLVEFRTEQRYWARLATPEPFAGRADLWLLTWLPGQETAPHDHGQSAAAFRVVQGTLTEYRWALDGTSRRAAFGAGQAQEVPVGAVHDVVNLGPEPAVSIHAYSPRLTAMKYYAVVDGALQPQRIVETDNPESEWVR